MGRLNKGESGKGQPGRQGISEVVPKWMSDVKVPLDLYIRSDGLTI